MTITELKQKRASLVDKNRELLDAAGEDGLTAENKSTFDANMEKAKNLKSQIEAREAQLEQEAELETTDDEKVNKTSDVVVNELSDRDKKKQMYALTADLFNAINAKDNGKISEVQNNLYEAGHYEGSKIQEIKNAGYSTLSDPDGGIFLPTRISEMIFEYEGEYGFIPQFGLELPIPSGREKIPSINSELEFFAIAEGSELKARKATFGGISLDPNQWGIIIPWTRKIEREAGERLVPVFLRKIAQASAKKKDKTFFSGDGTSAFHNIKGIETRAAAGDVEVSTAASGNTAFASLDPKDFLALQYKLPAAIRMNGVYVMHPDRSEELFELKDDAGNYVPQAVFRVGQDGEHFLYNKRVVYTEAAPNTDGTSENFGAYCNPEYIAYGNGMNMTSERMTEASIKDVDDSTTINLGASHQAALKVVEEWDLDFGFNEAFALGQTAAS